MTSDDDQKYGQMHFDRRYGTIFSPPGSHTQEKGEEFKNYN